MDEKRLEEQKGGCETNVLHATTTKTRRTFTIQFFREGL